MRQLHTLGTPNIANTLIRSDAVCLMCSGKTNDIRYLFVVLASPGPFWVSNRWPFAYRSSRSGLSKEEGGRWKKAGERGGNKKGGKKEGDTIRVFYYIL